MSYRRRVQTPTRARKLSITTIYITIRKCYSILMSYSDSINPTKRVYYETAGRYVTVPDTCEGCGECCKNFGTLADAATSDFFRTTSPDEYHEIVTPVELVRKLSKNEKKERAKEALAANLGIRESSLVLRAIEKGSGLIEIKGRCGNLSPENTCTQYVDRPNHPCREVVMGSYGCLYALDIAQNPHLL